MNSTFLRLYVLASISLIIAMFSCRTLISISDIVIKLSKYCNPKLTDDKLIAYPNENTQLIFYFPCPKNKVFQTLIINKIKVYKYTKYSLTNIDKCYYNYTKNINFETKTMKVYRIFMAFFVSNGLNICDMKNNVL